MLSTIGYGDMYPVSNIEMIMSAIWMLIGVAMFSIIMGQFRVTQDQYKSELGDPYRKEELDLWLSCLKKYNMGQDKINISLRKQIIQDYNYFVLNDRNQYFTDPNSQSSRVPKRVRHHLVVHYLFYDLIKRFQRFFNATFCDDNNMVLNYNLISMLTEGFMPRYFTASLDDDKIIYEQDMEVEEMYFVLDGKIGIGFHLPNKSLLHGQQKIAQ